MSSPRKRDSSPMTSSAGVNWGPLWSNIQNQMFIQNMFPFVVVYFRWLEILFFPEVARCSRWVTGFSWHGVPWYSFRTAFSVPYGFSRCGSPWVTVKVPSYGFPRAGFCGYHFPLHTSGCVTRIQNYRPQGGQSACTASSASHPGGQAAQAALPSPQRNPDRRKPELQTKDQGKPHWGPQTGEANLGEPGPGNLDHPRHLRAPVGILWGLGFDCFRFWMAFWSLF